MDNEQQNPAPQPQPQEQEHPRYLRINTIDVQLKPGFVLRKVGQAYMVMPTGPRMKDYQGMITLNEEGAFLYREMEKPEPSREKLVEACKKQYDATDEEANKAIDMFVQQCADCGLFPVITRFYDTVEEREVTEDELR
ncbi:MAG: PqqD family protein [Oscillospiraceae bacterium]|jgi:hypothetical protein|nr:PqqD family protein [Oscillospiraceae bacterium]